MGEHRFVEILELLPHTAAHLFPTCNLFSGTDSLLVVINCIKVLLLPHCEGAGVYLGSAATTRTADDDGSKGDGGCKSCSTEQDEEYVDVVWNLHRTCVTSV